MREPYGLQANTFYGFTDPHHRGTVNFTPERFENMMRAAHRAGWQMSSHVTGDAGVDLVLDAWSALTAICPSRNGATL